MLYKRVISSIIGVIIFILIISWGQLPFFILVSLIAAVGLKEFTKMTDNKNYYALLLSGLLFLILSYLNLEYKVKIPLEYLFIVTLLILFYDNYRQKELDNILSNISINIFALIYIVFGLIYFLHLRALDFKFGIWIVLIATWLTDIGAYFSGKFFGKIKMSPKISPNKTVEGAVGGILTSFVFVIGITIYLNIFSTLWIVYAFLLPFVAIAGDLFESALKRAVNVKDSGNIIPGHGGILDRFDSLLFTIPFTYFFLINFIN